MNTSRTMLGRRACPLCGFEAAHVKRSEGKLAYLHCPDCGFNAATRNQTQERHLLASMRPEQGAPGHVPQSLPPTAAPIVVAAPPPPAPEPAPAPKRKPAGLWDQLMGIKGDA